MKNVFRPFAFGVVSRHYQRRGIDYLDVGCGNHMPSITKRYFPMWRYFGIDRADYNIDERDKSLMEQYYRLDLTVDSMDVVPNEGFDLVMLNHVIEHLPNGLDVLRRLAPKVKAGGRIYLEFPSVRSLALPSMQGTLHFCDDSTHLRVYSIREVSNTLLALGFRVIAARTRRHWIRILLFPVIVPVRLVLRRTFAAGDFWDLFGFAEFVYAEKKAPTIS